MVNSKKIKVISRIFSDHNAVRFDVNYRKQTIKNTNIWRLKNTLLNIQKITEEIKKETKIYRETNENENTTTLNLMGLGKSSAKGKVHSNMSLPHGTREKLNK